MSLIAVPTMDEIPSDLRPKRHRTVIRPRLPEINLSDVPTVIGQRVLVIPAVVPEETEGGIALAADSVRHMQTMGGIGVVLAIGDLAFSEKRGYPAGYAPVKVGDWVNFHSHSGQQVPIRDRSGDMVQVKYLNDADILGVPSDPSAFMVMI